MMGVFLVSFIIHIRNSNKKQGFFTVMELMGEERCGAVRFTCEYHKRQGMLNKVDLQ